MTKTALLIVDYQNDFLPGGALAVPDGNLARPAIRQEASKDDVDLVVYSRDWHPYDHCSFQALGGPWPPHCIQGTRGAALDRHLLYAVRKYHAPLMVSKGDDRCREAYSAFQGRGRSGQSLEAILRHYNIERVRVVGLALDYCVKATALDAMREGFDTAVLLDATRPVGYLTGARAILELRAAGVSLR